MKFKNTDTLQKDINEVSCLIGEVEAKENRDKIVKQFEYFSKNPDKIEMPKMCKP